VLLVILVLLAFLLVEMFVFFDKKLREPLLFLAQVRVKQMATEAINAAITQELADTADAGKMIQWKMDQNGKVSGFLIDFKEQMRLTSRTVQIVDRVLKEKEEVPDHIPIGHALESPLISAFGPRVSVSFHPVSAVKAEVGTRQTETGINMVLIEVFIRIRTEIAVVIPFDKAPDVLETEIPLSYALVVGNVPMYYYDGKGNPVGSTAQSAPPIVLPAPEKQH
jgi:sporulation protein YunB